MEFSRQEYRSELPLPSPEHLPDSETEQRSSALQADSLPFVSPREQFYIIKLINIYFSINYNLMIDLFITSDRADFA